MTAAKVNGAIANQHIKQNILKNVLQFFEFFEFFEFDLVKVRTMVIIYIMVYSQSQRCNSFQIALSRTLQQFGISERGLESLRNLGITAHPRTVKAQSKLSSSFHSDTVQSFIESAIENEQLFIFLIDDYHNIHTQHRPEAKKTNSRHSHDNPSLESILRN